MSTLRGLIDKFISVNKKETLLVTSKMIKDGNSEKEKFIIVINDMAFGNITARSLKFFSGHDGVNVLPLSILWQAMFDGKQQLALELLSSKIVYDFGLGKTLREGFDFSKMILEHFSKYIVSTILFGSWSRGEAVSTSDVDITVIVDDTDVKEASRSEITEKIRKIVLGKAAEVDPKMNVQIFVLTTFWEAVRDANPVIFTLLRDGVPLFDRGLFVPWKLLLKMGHIKPTPEAIGSFIVSGKMLTNSVRNTMADMMMEKIYYSMINPAQALLMSVGLAPPSYGEVPRLLTTHFVSKGKLEAHFVKALREIIEIRKEIEHSNDLSRADGRSLDKYLRISEEFSKKVSSMFNNIQMKTVKEKIGEVEYLVRKGMMDVLKSVNVRFSEKNLESYFKKEVIEKKKVPESYIGFLSYITKLKKDAEKRIVTTQEVEKLERDAHEFFEHMSNYTQLQEIKGSDKFRIRVNYENKTGEAWVLGNKIFIIKDSSKPDGEVFSSKMSSEGIIGELTRTSISELTEKRKRVKSTKTATIRERTIESLKKIFGPKMEIVID